MKKHLFFLCVLTLTGCGGKTFYKTADHVDISRYMGKWYVISARGIFVENEAYNSTETYTWNEKEKSIDVDFRMRKGGFDGVEKTYPQKAWLYNTDTNAHLKVQFFWPLKFDYLILDIDSDYQWVAVGVPSQRYLWIMARTPKISDSKLEEILARIDSIGYSTKDMRKVPQRW
ncbi:MAG: lipocalin family protein [Deltaproteobacteria bacterium]|jgi:apolipoprotein D and lipocalin family protein|nr:lipocalin family protein [Deltaproteobacteria bacterium]